ncbi:MAG: alkene reductase [Bdellovibrionaceae bacterium]|nr:alkene reductase [Pseudobdellovibrionaceae bacterium]
MKTLFDSYDLAGLKLKNRVVMAPMTRSRAEGNVPNEMMVEYYRERASVGLIVTEGTSPSPNGVGYSRIPGLYSDAQVAGWRKVTDAVHAEGGHIFVQLMHTGRVFHELNLPPGAKGVAPSAKKLAGQVWTDQKQMQDYGTPQEMSLADIEAAREEFVTAAKNAIRAGFDGVELHGANGYLLEQFLSPVTNERTDDYGGTPEKRMRFVLEVAADVARAIGANKTAIRLSPYGTNAGTSAFEGVDAFFGELAKRLSELKLAYVHVVDHSAMGAPAVSPEVKKLIRDNFQGTYILSGGYDRERAEKELNEGFGDLVAFGRPLISNPDLVAKLKSGAALKAPDMTKAYTPGPEGYLNV